MRVQEIFHRNQKTGRPATYRYEIWVREIDGEVMEWSEEREGISAAGDIRPVWVSQSQLDRLCNKDGRDRQYQIKRIGSAIRMTEV